MSTFKLQVHSRDLAIPVIGNMASHTGYDLVEYDNNGNVLSIRSVDLIEENGEIRFDISEKRSGKTYIIDGKTQAWPDVIHFDDDPNQAVDQDFAEDKHFYTADVPVADPQAMFDRIVFDAKFRNALAESNIDGEGINYQALGPNCNTWTNYIDTHFLGTDVFNRLPESDGIIYNYTGKNKTFNDCSEEKDIRNSSILEEISDRFFDKINDKIDFNYDNLQITLYNTTSAINPDTVTGFTARISDGTYNFLFDSNNSSGNYIEDLPNNDSYIIAGKGNNDTIIAGDGNDIVDAGSGEYETGVKKFANLGTGSDVYVGGTAIDNVNSGINDTGYGDSANDTNHIYLGAGSDEFHGGDGIDIVDGGSGNVSQIKNDLKNLGFINIENITSQSMTDSSSDTNTINLGAGNDEYRGGKGKDIVHGGADDDKIWGDDGENELYGEAGNDHLYGGKDKDIIDGGDDNDYIHGYDGNNELSGGTSNDHIYGGKDNDTINGGTGKDVMSPGTGINTIDCGQDNDQDIVAINNNAAGIDTIKNATPHDYISCNGGFNLETVEQVGNDVIIFGNNGNKIIFKDVKVDDSIPDENMPTLYQPDGTLLYWHNGQYQESATHFPPYIEEPEDIDYEAFLANAGSGSQNIVTGTNNYIILEESQDFTNATPSTTVMNASGEQVWFTSNATNSRYIGCNAGENITINRDNNNVFAKGGIDRISIASSNNHIDAGSGNDTIEIGNYRFYGNNNTINGGTGNDTINVSGSDNTIDGGADSDTITISSGTNNLIIGGTGNDTIKISTQNNIVEWKSGDGYDTVSANNNNLIRIKDMSLQDVLIQNNGTFGSFRIVSKNNNNQGVNFGSVKYYEVDGTQYNVENGLTLTQTDEDETIYGTNANDTIIGNKGNDTIYGYGGINTYVWNIGDGLDTIDGSGGTNHIKFGSNIKFEDLQIDYAGGNHGYDAFIYIKGNKEEGILYRDFLDPQRNIASLIFEDGTTVTNAGATYSPELKEPDMYNNITGSIWNDTMLGDDENNSLSGGDGDDVLIGGKGNDTLDGGEGNNTYIWNIGDGRDEISIRNSTLENKYGAIGISTIEFGEGISFEKLNFRGQHDKLFIYVGENDAEGIVLDEYRDKEHPVFLKFKDGSTVNLSTIGLTFQQTDEDNYMSGTFQDDIIHLSNNGGTAYGLFGNNIIYGGDGNDTIYGTPDFTNEGDIHGNNHLYGGKGNDFICGGNGKDYLEGEEGNDVLHGDENDDTLYGGTGDDDLFGGEGDDTYIYKLGDGNDYIFDEGGNDKIVFGEGITLDDLSFSRDRWSQYRSNVYIDISKTNSRIEICDQMNKEWGIDTLEFADGSQVNLKNITDQLTQAMNSFGADTSSTTDTLSNPTQDVSDMYSLAASQDLTRKAI